MMRAVLGSIAMTGILATGCGLWALFTSREQRNNDILKNLPESSPVPIDEKRKNNVAIMQALKDAAETNDNFAHTYARRK